MSRHSASPRKVGMRPVKRSIAVVAALLGLALVAASLAVLGFTVQETGRSADPDTAFSATEVVPRALEAQITWHPDDPDLARRVEPATREQLTATWLRAHDALERAARGDTSGLDVWFVGPALDQANGRYAGDHDRQVSALRPIAHRLHVRFYSLDGQVAVITSDATYERAAPDGSGERIATLERVEAILVLADGNWRIHHLERLPDTPPAGFPGDI